MGPFTASEPKVMIPVGNRPILEHVVRALVEQDLREIVIVVGYRRERIMSYFGDGKPFDARIEYAMEGKQLGTGHSLFEARTTCSRIGRFPTGIITFGSEAVKGPIRAPSPAARITAFIGAPSLRMDRATRGQGSSTLPGGYRGR